MDEWYIIGALSLWLVQSRGEFLTGRSRRRVRRSVEYAERGLSRILDCLGVVHKFVTFR